MNLYELSQKLDNLIKEKHFKELKATYLLNEIKGVPLNNLNSELQKVEKLKKEIDISNKEIENYFIKIDEVLQKNFDQIDIKIFTLKKYKNLSFEKVAELINYSPRQTQRRYKKMMNFEL